MSNSLFIPHNELKIILANYLQEFINSLSQLHNSNLSSFQKIYPHIGPCAKPELGQLTLSCFSFAKEWKLSPAKVAQDLQKLITENSNPYIMHATATGPYLNFSVDLEKSLNLLFQEVQSQKYFSKKFLYSTEKMMVEYSQPNTHKEMHVGHMRNVCLGASIVNLYRYIGNKVISCTYPGDVGTHVAKCLWYLKKNNLTPPETRKGAWLGSIYSKAHNLLEDERGTPQEEKNKNELTAILKELHSKAGPYYDLWKITRQWSLDQMAEVYQWSNISFDYWFFESEVDEPSLKLVDEYYQKGIFIEDQGAIGIDLSNEGLGFCMVRKSDGNGLYATKDLELARRKFEQHNISKNLYVVDVRQSLHFKQVFKTLEKMGFENAKKSYHLPYEMVELPNGAMSSRKGNIIPIQTLIDEMQSNVKNQYLDKYKDSWSQDEINLCSHHIALAAIKYGMLKIDPGKKIVFDLAEWLKIDGNSGPYLLYSYARSGSILQKANFDSKNLPIQKLNFQESIEKELLFKMLNFNEAVLDSAVKNSPNIICNYLYELCQNMNTFYAHCSINNAPDASSKETRLRLLYLFREILKQGLQLIGISVVERM